MRSWREEDCEPFAAMNADPQVMRHFSAPLTRGESDALVERITGQLTCHGFGLWALEVAETGEFIGFTGLAPMPDGVPGQGGTEIGWRLSRSAWGKGYATEAGRAALSVAFDEVGLDAVWSLTAAVNDRSIAVMVRLGMTHVASADHPQVAAESALRPHLFYRLDLAEWSRATS